MASAEFLYTTGTGQYRGKESNTDEKESMTETATPYGVAAKREKDTHQPRISVPDFLAASDRSNRSFQSPQPSMKTVLESRLSELDRPLELLFVPGVVPSAGGKQAKPPIAALLAPDGGPPSPGSLVNQITRAYDLSVSKALDANIPVVGSGAVGAQRRVIVLERVGYNERQATNGVEQVGFAIRLCITVNKLDANVKLSLPFITASAQLGATEAVWTLQIVGLTGPKIAAVDIIPTELNVETFVIAKQSLQRLIEALSDPTTVLDAQVIARVLPPSSLDDRYLPIVAQVAALGAISRGWSLQDAASRYHWDASSTPATFATAYQDVAGITNLTDRPSKEAIGSAARLLGAVGVGPR